jgi:pimeloyl-ACP methyl ester carboxylesterase
VTTFRLQNKKRWLYYRIRGTGPNLLLIHGLGSSGADWEFQVRALERRFRVIVPDLPGCGFSSPVEGNINISDFARRLWGLMDHLQISTINIAGFSMGGAVAMEMALQRPDHVPRLALINTLLTYRIDHWRKWLEARMPPLLIRLLGIRRAAKFAAARLFPKPWQQPLRDRTAQVLGRAVATSYVSMGRALERWSSIDRVHQLKARTLMIAAEHDYTALAEKKAMAKLIGAQIVVVRGSRHGTPFDSIEATNACLLALFTDRPLANHRWDCDRAPKARRLAQVSRFVEEQAALLRLEVGV